MTAEELRKAFTGFFVDRGHTLVASEGLIPHHPAAPLLANAGMNQFIGILAGEQPAPDPPRATSVQKCFRTADIDIIGDTTRHLTFFEMLGNFSFGNYFKEHAIPYAWEVVTGVLDLDPKRIWVTVHLDDDEAEGIWRDVVGVPGERIQRMGEDNFWEMAKGAAGPCGPCSELYWDKGDGHGAPGGPAGGGAERYVEIWNLVFMQYRRRPDGSLEDLPRRNIDTGAGLERILPIVQGVNSVFETDVLAPLVAAAAAAVGRNYGRDDQLDRSLRIMADHGRAMTMLINDGVFPSNEDRGYVLRRIIRRAVRHAYGLGVDTAVTPGLITTAIEVLGGAYPDLRANATAILDVAVREEDRFAHTLRAGSNLLDQELASARSPAASEADSRLEPGDGPVLSGAVAFKLRDTFGFPLELTLEIAAEHQVEVDVAGFEAAMNLQRTRARASRSRRAVSDVERVERYRLLLDDHGPTRFVGYAATESRGRVLAQFPIAGPQADARLIEIVLDVTPFYAEGGGQVGDTGLIVTDGGRAEVIDTTYAATGLWCHRARIVEGDIVEGEEATATVDTDRRAAIRRNHTGTHLLHWALRKVLGDHVKQAGSLVAPDRLRFDFSHYAAVTPDELDRIERLANNEILTNSAVRVTEMPMAEARDRGAIAFFGDKYGDVVRVVEAGAHSVELCGGTHVDALGSIGPVTILGETSIGANLRRIEALTGEPSLDRIRDDKGTLRAVAAQLRVAPAEIGDRVSRLIDDQKAAGDELRQLRRSEATGRAEGLAREAVDGVVVRRCDGTGRDDLRDLALAVRALPGIQAVVLGSVPDGGGVALVAAVAKGAGLVASDLLSEAARTVGGGGGKSADVAVAGGRHPERLDEALDQVRAAAALAGASQVPV